MAETQTQQKKHDWALKLLALVCALVLWFYAEAEENPQIEMQFDVPVQYLNQAEDYVIQSSGVQSVRITVKGKEVELTGLRSDDFTATVDLQNAGVGTGEYKIAVTTPGRVERFTYQPMKTKLQIDQIQTKEVPVRVRTTGSLAEGVHLVSTEVVPNTVILEGLSSQLEELIDIETEAIEITELNEDTVMEAALHIPEGITIQGEKTVQVHFIMQLEEQTIPATIEVRNVPDGMTAMLQPSTVTLTVTGTADLLANKQEWNRIQLYVDCSGLTAGEHTLPVQIAYRGQLVVSKIAPDVVTVIVAQKEQPDETQDQNFTDTTIDDEGDLT